MKETGLDHGLGFLAFDTQNRSMCMCMCMCLPKKKTHSLPNSTALNLKIETKVDLSPDGSLKCPLKGMTALPGECQGTEMGSRFSIRGGPGKPTSSVKPLEIR